MQLKLKKNKSFWGLFEISNMYIFDEIQNKQFMNNKVAVDCGACYGDTSLYFAKCLPCTKVYAFEPELYNINRSKYNFKKYDKDNKIILIEKGVGDKNESQTISSGGLGSKIGSGDQKIEIITLDSFFDNSDDVIGCIKRDIEGFEYQSVLGAYQIIKKHKPILIISIYHNPQQFYELKPIIESWNLGYKFKIRKLDPRAPRQEVTLICYH